MKKFFTCCLAAALAAFAANPRACASVVSAVPAALFSDDFSVGQASSTNSNASGFDAGTSISTSYGSRSLFTLVTSNSAPGDARSRTAIGNGALTCSSDSEVAALGFVGYAFNTPINLSSVGSFQFTLLNNDQPGIVLLTAIDSVGNESQYQYTIPLPIVAAGTTPVIFTVPDLFAINNSDPTPTDLTKIQRLQFGFGNVRGEDLGIDSFQLVAAVPEPSTWALLGMGAGLLGLTLHRRRATRV